jgi:predicted phage tail protein
MGGGAPTSVMLDVSGPIVTSVPLGLVDRFEHHGVPPGTYTFSVRAVNAQGVSAPSNAVTLSFPGQGGTVTQPAPVGSPCSAVPSTPSNLASQVAGSTVSLTWQGAVGAQFSVDVAGSYVGSFNSPVPSLVGAAPPGTYVVSVRAVNACGSSPSTAPITVIVQ